MGNFIEQNFFVIASDNFQNFSRRIYGYVIKDNTMYHNYIFPDRVPEFSEENMGYFTLINCEANKITISMDAMGYGLVYYFNNGEFWAASNSFYKLMTYLKTRVRLGFDREYGYLFAGIPHYATCTHIRSLVNEIKLLALNEQIVIDKANNAMTVKKLQFSSIVKLGTPESLQIIDDWAHKWIRTIRELVESGQHVNVQLSGGFDSRFVMALVLASGIDMRKINIESSVNMKEDFAIASQIAEHYNFKLNSGVMAGYKQHRMGLQSILDANVYARLGNHKEILPYNHYTWFEKPIFMFGGYGCMRCWFQDSTDGFIRFCYRDCIDTETSKKTIAEVYEETFDYIDKRFDYSITRKSNFLNYTYNYGKGRYNYGTSIQILGAGNQFMCSPIADPVLIRIDPIFEGNDDYDILYSYVLYRFAPDLLNFPIDKNRCFKPESVAKAKKLSDSFPLSFNLQEKVSLEPLRILTSYTPEFDDNGTRNFKAEDFFGLFLENTETRSIFTAYYGNERYDAALNSIQEKKGRHYERDAFGILATVEAIKACKLSAKLNTDLNHFDTSKYLDDNKTCLAVFGSDGRAAADARLLGQNNIVYTVPYRKVNFDKRSEDYLKNKSNYVIETDNMELALEKAEYILISGNDFIDESSIEDLIIKALQINSEITFVFRIAIHTIGFIDKITKKYGHKFIVCRSICKDGQELHDSLFARNIILGVSDDGYLHSKAERFGTILRECSADNTIPVLFLQPKEVEALMFYAD